MGFFLLPPLFLVSQLKFPNVSPFWWGSRSFMHFQHPQNGGGPLSKSDNSERSLCVFLVPGWQTTRNYLCISPSPSSWEAAHRQKAEYAICQPVPNAQWARVPLCKPGDMLSETSCRQKLQGFTKVTKEKSKLFLRLGDFLRNLGVCLPVFFQRTL